MSGTKYFFLIKSDVSLLKNLGKVFIFFALAIFAIFLAGSTPNILNLFLLNSSKKKPSLLATSNSFLLLSG